MSEAMQMSFIAVFDSKARAVDRMHSKSTACWCEATQLSRETALDEIRKT